METYTLSRQIPVEEAYDVLVAGGGPAGTAAAICAARLGAKVLLAEQTGCLGGMGTSGLVTTFGPMADGKRTLVGGFARELIETMYEGGYLGPHVTPDFWTNHLNRWIPFKPEPLKRVLDAFAVDAGVDVRFYTTVIDADVEGQTVKGAVISNMEGYRYIRAKTFIDATGDADLAALCGAAASWRSGTATPWRRARSARSMPVSIGAILPMRAAIGGASTRSRTRRRRSIWSQAIEDGHFSQVDQFMPGMNGEHSAQLNAGHIFGLNGLDARSVSDRTHVRPQAGSRVHRVLP